MTGEEILASVTAHYAVTSRLSTSQLAEHQRRGACAACEAAAVVPEPSIPGLVPHCRWCSWFRLECPACGRRFWASAWRSFAYPLHYAGEHLGIKAFRGLT